MKIVKSIGNILIGLCLLLAVVTVLKAEAGQPDSLVGMQEEQDHTQQNKTTDGEPSDGEQSDRDHAAYNDTDHGQVKDPKEQTDQNTQDSENNPKELLLAFGGDVLLSDGLNAVYDKGGIASVYDSRVLEKMQAADILMVNQEFPFSTRGTAMEDKQYTFRADPRYVQILKDMGVDIVTLANNHTLDFGSDALLDTLSTLEDAGLPYVGAGENLERASRMISIGKGGRKIGFLGASRVIPVTGWYAGKDRPGLFATYDPAQMLEQITRAKETCDYVVAYVHWGVEYADTPEEYQRQMAQKYIDAGADLVVGSHPHVLQGIEFYKGKPILYSLGNFLFGQWAGETVMAEITISADGETGLKLVPLTMKNNQTFLIEEPKRLFEELQRISFGVSISEDGIVSSNAE
ncbi:CapA family protein [Diplocloster hominis]|uniref:CapA family protein n=1 Tax=Diplocloster hominis TaxID=3079010 RepID=UPI0031BA11E5